MNPVPEDTTKVVRQGLERTCRDFSERIAPTGFVRTKKVFWTRRHPLTVDFIHFHRQGISYGKPINYSVEIRVHFGIRVLNDTFIAAALNGPHSDPGRLRAGLYHLRFNAKTGSTYDRCVDDLVRFVLEQGEPWFLRFRQPEALLNFQDSPLQQPDKDRLRLAMDGHSDPAAEALSLKELGIKTR
jgi:hypothetical protein